MFVRILARNLNFKLSKTYLNCCNNSKSFFSTTQATRRQFNKFNQNNAMSKYFLQDRYDNFTYSRLDYLSKKLSDDLLSSYNKQNLDGEKIAVLCSNNYTYLVSVIAIWKAGGVPLGLNKTYPINLLEYFINDSKCKLAINGMSDEDDAANNTALTDLLDKHNIVNYKLVENKFHLNSENKENDLKENLDALENFRRLLNMEERKNKEAMILYTSGTSGPPKGVVLTCGNLASTCDTIKNAWQMSPDNHLLHVLPLNHVHGLIYCLLTCLYAGSYVEMLPKFNAELVWSKLLETNCSINSFMAVPTIYVQLVNLFLKDEKMRSKYSDEYVKKIFKEKIKLIVSGSAPLNVKTHNEWLELTGYPILERYGMTEIGLGLSNPFIETETSKRTPGAVGRPYGNTFVRIVEPHDGENDKDHVLIESSNQKDTIIKDSESIFGELQIKGDMVFKYYHEKPEQTKETFTDDDWFKTGDTAEFLKDIKIYKLIGRTSVDVIKSGGYKISALDIEKELLGYPLIEDVAVMGISDAMWGQRIFSLLVLKPDVQFDQNEYVKWCKSRLPKQSVPTLIKIIDKMPRNQLGKVNKKELIKTYEKIFEEEKNKK